MHVNLRLQDPDTMVTIMTLWVAGDAGVPVSWVPRHDLVKLGFAELYFSFASPHRRLRLSKLGREVVTTLVI
jgi:hypothetical protein